MIMRVTLFQTDIFWEDKLRNLANIESGLQSLRGKTDLIVLPEMFTTGFSMNSRNLSEENSGNTISTIKRWAKDLDTAICGSHIAKENGRYFNRGFFITPHSEYYYDKRHLFRMGEEKNYFEAGSERLIVKYKEFNICLQICYDLRFPVWARNVNNEYDLLIYVANWPESRIFVWQNLLIARALENMSYVCGVNRIGKDGNDLKYNGMSALISPRGKAISSVKDSVEWIETVEIDREELELFRKKFPVWKDADNFKILK